MRTLTLPATVHAEIRGTRVPCVLAAASLGRDRYDPVLAYRVGDAWRWDSVDRDTILAAMPADLAVALAHEVSRVWGMPQDVGPHAPWIMADEQRDYYLLQDVGGDAGVEGHAVEMRRLAAAIRRRGRFVAKRCRVSFDGMTSFRIGSPKNSGVYGSLSVGQADDLAAAIEALLGTVEFPKDPTIEATP